MSHGSAVRPPTPERVVLASGNRGKLRELGGLLAGIDMELLAQSELGVTEIEETGVSFVENALIKARNAAAVTGLAAIADDSGIAVDHLNGAPGIRSARYAGVGASDEENLAKLLRDMEGVPDAHRQCRFHCLMVYLEHPADPTPIICDGVWEGTLLHEPRGGNGFGYDPIFFVPQEGCSAAELTAARKNAISHRGQALRQLLRRLAERHERHVRF